MKKNLQLLIFSLITTVTFSIFRNAQGMEDSYREEEKKSKQYTLYSKEVQRSFEDFRKDCGEEERVMVVGTGYRWLETHETYKRYPKNTYLVDYNWKVAPDLLMSVEIETLPAQYVGQFNMVIFEGFQQCYDVSKAFSNVNNLLNIGGIFLLWDPEGYYRKNHLKTLGELGFLFDQFIEKIKEADSDVKDYVGGGCWIWNDSFLMMKKNKNLA